MSSQFKQIGLIGTHRNPLVADTVQQLIEILTQWGLLIIVEKETAAALNSFNGQTASLASMCKTCDLAIAVGGDGNLLSAARHFSIHDVPVLGINRGQLGFLTDIKPEELVQSLKCILAGEYFEEKRFLVEGRIKQDGEFQSLGNALNDIVLFPGEVAQLIEFELFIDQRFVYSQRSDGLIIATPTGSTAYALSAGGPIMQPHLNVLVLVPMFPHTLTSRPIVVDADSEIVIHIAEHNKRNPRLSYDGQSHVLLKPGAQIHIQKQQRPLRLIHPKNHDYYEVLRTKLHWGKQLIPLTHTANK